MLSTGYGTSTERRTFTALAWPAAGRARRIGNGHLATCRELAGARAAPADAGQGAGAAAAGAPVALWVTFPFAGRWARLRPAAGDSRRLMPCAPRGGPGREFT